MDESINQRIKRLRKELKLTQTEFASVIAISSGQLACIETERRAVNNRTIKLICDSFKINAEWLRTGQGAVYRGENQNRHSKLLAMYDTLKPQYQNFVMNSIDWFIKTQNEEAG